MYLVGGKHWLERETTLPILTERLVKRKGLSEQRLLLR